MEAARIGSDLRILRRRRGWSQQRLAFEARVPRWVISSIETGRADQIPMWRLAAVVGAVGGYLSVRIQYHGDGLDRLRDRRHADLVEAIVSRLRMDGWQVATEVSFNEFGERGSIDVLAFDPATGALLVVEVKSVVPDIGGMLMTLDRKARLASRVAARQLGWVSKTVSRLLVLPEDRTARRRVTQHEATFSVSFPARNVAVRRWLAAPEGPMAGLMFLPTAQDANTRQTGRRASPSPRAGSRSRRRGDGPDPV
jgi:DNA-binding XRE family transcriptional regulator